jgi:hypothetical protein
MIAPPEVYRKAQALGLTVGVDGADLVVKPASKCPVEFVAELKRHKAELLRWLFSTPSRWQAVPPNRLPLDLVKPRATVEDRERVIAYLLCQLNDQAGALVTWLANRSQAYYDGGGRRWDCGLHMYAAARDAACWQLARKEPQVWEWLADFGPLNDPKK